MSYSELNAIARRETSRRADGAHALTLHAVAARRNHDGRLLRTGRRLLGRGVRPGPVMPGEAAGRTRPCEPADTAPA